MRKEYELMKHFPNVNSADISREKIKAVLAKLAAPDSNPDEKRTARIKSLIQELAAELVQ